MSNAGKNPMRWLETTSTMQAATPAETANNIPTRRFGTSQEESKTGPFMKTTSLLKPAAATTTTTATQMFDTATTVAGKNSGSDTAGLLVNRITASPAIIKTQIAKISYTHSDDRSSTHSTRKHVNPPMTTMIQRLHLEHPKSPTTQRSSARPLETAKYSTEDYAQKKSERELEIREIQEMLDEIKNPINLIEVTTQTSHHLLETTNPVPKFERIPNESAKISNDNKTNTSSKSAEKPIQNTAAAEAITIIPADLEQLPVKTPEKAAPTSASSSYLFQRSKTDINLLTTKAATTRRRKTEREAHNEPRSKSTQPPATKSSELLPGDSPDKKKFYNPQELRRFMEEQRKKRQKTLEYLNTYRNQQQNEKEQIKRRLEELRKYSRKVVSKNIKNAHKRTGGTSAKIGDTETGGGAIDEASPRKTAKLDSIVFKRTQGRRNQLNKNVVKTKKISNEHKANAQADNVSLETQKEPLSKIVENKDTEKSSALMENHKRIGLLRKPEIKDHSFGAIKEFSFDKENVALDLLTPKLTTTTEQSRIKEKIVVSQTTAELQPAAEKTEQPQPPTQSNQTAAINNLTLEMPEARLQRTRVVREQATQVRETESLMSTGTTRAKAATASSVAQTPVQNERTELPYWLKPSAVQVYPYNFIMAVRRKLEAIANPTPQPCAIKTSRSEAAGEQKKPVDTPLSSMPKERDVAATQQNVKRRLLVPDIVEEQSHNDDFGTHSIDKVANKSSTRRKQPTKKSQETPPPGPAQLLSHASYSDITSNFSSISIAMPVSNTCSEVSSIKSDSNIVHSKTSKSAKTLRSAEEDNTTVSSSIFNSPEKQKKVEKKVENEEFKMPRPVSPLSLESVEHLKISSKAKETNIAKRHHEETAEVVEVDFNRLLQDFNRSLSQVIEVNEQLKSTLDKSQLLISPERKHSSKNSSFNRQIPTEDEYSTDFEGGSSIHAALKQLPTKVMKKDPMPQQKKNLFHQANKVKPLQTSSKSETKSDAVQNSPRKNSVNSLDINLESVSNSSAEQSSPSKLILNSSSRAVSSPNSLGKRLESIERLKENLRQSILVSKAHRNELEEKADRLMEDLSGSAKEENEEHQSDAEEIQLLHVSSKNQKSTTSLSNSTVDSHHLSSRRSLFPVHSSSEHSEIKTTLSEIEDIANGSVQQSASAKTAGTNMNRSGSSPSIADKSYTFDSKSNSPKAKTFTLTQNATTHLSSAQNSTNHEVETEDTNEETIAEEIQKIVTSAKQYDLQKDNEKILPSSADSSAQTSKQSAAKAAYVKAHINRSRGDFMPAADDTNAASNDSNFRAAATAANNSRTDSDSAAPPPSYKALSATTKNAHSPPSLSDKSELRHQKSAKKSSKLASSHELITLFNQSDMELSIISSRNGSISETSLNYSSVGLYEKLIQTETTKSEQLTVLLKMREKALLDRTKGQIAWLELQKERYKAKGLLMQITAIKKKQRGILLKMEKEREEIKRILQSTTSTTSTHSSTRHQYHHQSAGLPIRQQHQETSSPKRKRAEPSSAPPLLLPPLPILSKTTRSNPTAQQQQQQQQQKITSAHSAPIIRANYELESNRTLEELLQKREADLRKRREHVERLIRWHQRLDQEEAEVQQLELMLLNCNNVHAQPLNENQTPQKWQQQQQQLLQHTVSIDKQQSQEQLTAVVSKVSPNKKQGRDAKMERRLKDIDKSLRELSSISVSNNSATSTDESATTDADYVRTSGSKLNKLWRRLTTQQVERFEPARRYKLCKADLERLYEEAKVAVLRDFAQDEQRVAVELLDKTTATVLSQSSLQESLNQEAAENANNKIVIPRLNLNFSSGQSDAEDAMVQHQQQERGEDSTASLTEAVSTQSTCERPTTPQGDTYSPCTAEEEFVRQESGNNSSFSSCTASSSSSSSTSPQQSKLAPQSSAQSIERHREELLERNVQKFMELTQRFNGAQAGDGLQRSLSDTQIADNCSGGTKKSSNKSAISQRNIAYYGVKTQKRPSKVVNVEIANSLSSASSILTASNTLRSVQSLKTQIFSSESTSDSKPVSANVNNIPSPVSAVTTAEASTPTSVASSPIESLDVHDSEASKIAASTSVATNRVTLSGITSSTTATNPSQLATLTQSETQAQQISEKLEEISAAMSKLTQSNSLLISSQSSSNSKQSSQQQPQIEQNTKSASVKINTEPANTTASNSQSYTFEVITEAEVSQSNSPLEKSTTVPSNSLKSATTTPPPPKPAAIAQNESSEALSESMLLAKYNADFEDTLDETRLEDISLPQFETTIESSSTQNEEDEVAESDKTPPEREQQSNEVSAISSPAIPTKATNKLSSVSTANLPPPPMPPPPPPPTSTSPSQQLLSSTSKETVVTFSSTTNNGNISSTNNNNNNIVSSSSQPQLMPDIINELELRRCQPQVQQYEHVTAVPYNMYMREIPNKPPPPYVPPAHGSPMTTIFPSEERIKDLTYRRTHELYCEILKTEYTNEKGERLPSVLAEKITNIYERIILDICREYLEENREVLTKSDPSTFHGNLAFFNPPDRLSCLQTFVYKEVRRCLAMDKKQPKRSQVYSVYGQRAKRDHIGKIIIQEMYDEDDKWCNFHHEEAEVLDLIIEEMVSNLVGDLAKEVLLEEGGTVEEEVVNATQVVEELSCVTNDETIYEDASSLIESTTSALDDDAAAAAAVETVDAIEKHLTSVEGAAAVADTSALTAA